MYLMYLMYLCIYNRKTNLLSMYLQINAPNNQCISKFTIVFASVWLSTNLCIGEVPQYTRHLCQYL